MGHRAGQNTAERIQYLATVGNRIPRTCGNYNGNIVTAASSGNIQCESNSSDSDYYFGDDDCYCSNDNDIDNYNSLTEANNLIYTT